jgi:hypothetical protein
MLLQAYAILLAIGLALNLKDRRMLAVTALVGASLFIPVPRDTALHFYSFCIAAECVVALVALRIGGRGAVSIAELCLLLVIAHCMGYALDGSPPLSPYRVIVKLLETSQLVCCIVASPYIATRLRNHDATTT